MDIDNMWGGPEMDKHVAQAVFLRPPWSVDEMNFWAPSEHIEHAMELVSEMKKRGHAFHLYSPIGSSAFEASFYPSEIKMAATGASAQLAICRAALKAKAAMP